MYPSLHSLTLTLLPKQQRIRSVLSPLTNETIDYLNKAFVIITRNPEIEKLKTAHFNRLDAKDCRAIIKYYDTRFQSDMRSYQFWAVVVALIAAIAITLYVYGMVKWVHDLSSPEHEIRSTAFMCLHFVGIFGGIGIVGLVTGTVALGLQGAKENKGNEFKEYLKRAEDITQWTSQHNTYLLTQRVQELIEAGHLFDKQLDKRATYEKLSKTIIPKILDEISQLPETAQQPQGVCPEPLPRPDCSILDSIPSEFLAEMTDLPAQTTNSSDEYSRMKSLL